jgi:NAD-dependent SIR2 family protein deacetylase
MTPPSLIYARAISAIIVGSTGLLLAGCGGSGDAAGVAETPPKEAPEQVQKYPVYVNRPDSPPRVVTGVTNVHGQVAQISCATCHSTTEPNRANRSADLDQFHQGLQFQHGDISCHSCHNPDDYNTLRLADGRAIEFPDVMQLCSQCHGPQARDYRNGSHGGMTGHWDLTKGPRSRNNCVDCHDPHTPAYPIVKPVFPPMPTSKNHSHERSK